MTYNNTQSNEPATQKNDAKLSSLALADLLDPNFEEAYDRLTRLATKLLKVPIALVSVSTGKRQFYKSFVGLGSPWSELRTPPMSPNYCQHVCASGEVLVVEDALKDARLQADPVTVEMGVVAYLGIPMTIADGRTLGSFCVIHTEPHSWTETDIAILTDLAASVISEIHLRAALKRAELAKQQAEDSNRRVTAILEQILDGDAPASRHTRRS